MDRRHFLLLAAGGVSGLAGCGAWGREASPDAPGSPSPGTTDAGPGDDAGRIEVGVETARYLVTAYERTPAHRAIEPDAIVPESHLPDPLRSALESARADGYETDDVSEALLAAVDRFRRHGPGYRFEPYVRLDGTPYAFDPTVPVFVARLEFDVEDADPARAVGYDDLERFDEPVRDFVRTIGAFTAESPRDAYRISVVPPSVRTFLDRYEFVDDPGSVGRIETERVDPGPPYSIELRELTTEDLWGRPVLDGGSLPDDLRRFLAAAAASDRRAPVHPPLRSEHRTDEVPEAYFDRLRSDDGSRLDPYVALDGTVYAFRVRDVDRSKLPAEVSVTAGSSEDRPSFTVEVVPSEAGPKPDVEGTVEFESRGTLPSVLWVETGADRHLLPSDAYESIRWEPAEEPSAVDRRVRNVARESISPGDELTATYRVPDGVPAGTHRAWGRFDVKWTDAATGRRYPRLAYPFQVVLTVRDS